MRILSEFRAGSRAVRGGRLRAEKAQGIIDPENISASVGSPGRAGSAARRSTSSANTVVAVGHAHIDRAWLRATA